MVSASVRQSPPPVTDDKGMPKGAVLSPPESPATSDDDDLPEVRGRRIENLKELHAAISQIPQHRESSPGKADAGDLLVLPSQSTTLTETLHHSFSTGSLEALGHSGHKVSHTRSVTEPSIQISKSADNSISVSEEDSDDDMPRKPQMVRKKSGELVRPALRPPSRRRPSSMPGTPTFSKAVHFDSHLEHVRHFLQVDRPLAVSAGTSPAENYDSDSEYPFPGDRRTPRFEWEIIMNSFPVETDARKALPVRLERLWMSPDQKSLIGSVAVANIAFHKHVTCRFTLDYWKTTSEVAAEYVAEIVPKQTPQGHDRFQFVIKLSDMANLESRTLFFCIRYNVGGQEFWDNNNNLNFQVDFKKKLLQQGGQGAGLAGRPAGALPRSNRRSNASSPRPRSMPVGFDDFSDNPKVNTSQSIQEYLGESNPPLRLKTSKSTSSIPSDNLTSRLSSPSGQAFANRYDFGASLTAAMQAAKDGTSAKSGGGGLYMKVPRKTTPAPAPSNAAQSKAATRVPVKVSSLATSTVVPTTRVSDEAPSSASISNATYEEIVNKYCFFGSKQSSPQLKDGTMRNGPQVDGAMDELVYQSSTSTTSSNGSPLHIGSLHHLHTLQHRPALPQDPNPYFDHPALMTITAAAPVPTISQQDWASSQPRTASPASSQSTARPASPNSIAGSLAPFAGTSPLEFSYSHLQDRFPFTGPDAHAATAIRG